MTDAATRASANGEERASRASRLTPGLFAGAVFASAALVFLVEPMIAKLVLPTLGGSPAVWNTSLAFFQAALLVGYAYAHLLQRLGSVRRQAIVHGVVLIAAALVLPLRVSHALGEPGALPPALWLVGVLTLSVGAPFAALSATAPLVQAWYARVRSGEADAVNPYVLYAASNLGSLMALLAYPVLVEPVFRLTTQRLGWSLGYGAFVLVMAAVARIAWTARASDATGLSEPVDAPPTTWLERLIWVALAAAPSSLMLGVTTHITTDIASAPFLWVAPLALYLLTFIIAFQTRPLIASPYALMFQAAAMIGCFLTFSLPINMLLAQIGLNLTAFFLTALVCHQALAARRPAPARLTEFYLLMSLGGVIGGGFNAFVAPLIFDNVVEYPLVLMLACLARPWGRGGLSYRQTAWLLAGLTAAGVALALKSPQGLTLPIKIALAVTAVMAVQLRNRAWIFLLLSVTLALTAQMLAPQPDVLKTERGFFGVLRITRLNAPGLGPTRLLAHGTTLHGGQAEDPAKRCLPLVYYAPNTPIGQVFGLVQARKPAIRIGAIGMGTGTVAAYARSGDSLRFFEIDPQVVGMSTNPANFSYIKGCARGRIDWVLGDARLTLAREPGNQFDILLVDAFSSDSIPAHLLTVEAMRGYLTKIKPDGVIIMHLSNRNLELASPVAGIAQAAGGAALRQHHDPPTGSVPLVDTAEDAMIVARNAAALAPYRTDRRWTPALSHGVRVWTDDYTNLFGAMVRRLQQPYG
jgi:spermidine synthase